ASDASGHLRGVKTYASGAGFVTRALVTAWASGAGRHGDDGGADQASDASGHLRGVKTYASGAGFVTRALVTAWASG
ncbi:hypothetical protein CTI14_69300, partial [Methylobacterium radiotolerans]